MSDLSFKYIPLTFISSQQEIQRQIRNTIVFSYLSNKYNDVKEFSEILVSTQYGLNAAANELGEHKFLRISDIKEGVVDWESVPLCECKDEETYKLFKNDILVARTGGTTGKSFLIDEVPYNAVFAGYLIRLRTKEDIKPSIVYEFLNSYAYWSQISELKMGSAQPNVNAQKLKTLKIPLAPKEILEEIEKLFSGKKYNFPELSILLKSGKKGYDLSHELKTLFETQVYLISKLRQSILQEAVQGKLTEKWRKANPDVEHAEKLLERIKSEKQQLIKEKKIKKEKPLPPITKDDIPYKLPDGWVWCRLRDLVSVLGDGIHGTPEYTLNGPVHFVNGNNLSDGIIEIKSNTKTVSEEECLKHKRELNNRTVLVSINGTIGNTAFYNGEKVMLGKSACYFNLLSDINKEYIRQLIKTKYFLDYAFDSATGTTIKNVSLRTMREFIVPLPAIIEQKAIVEKVNTLMALCDRLENGVKQSKEQIEKLMKSVLREVFEGEEKECMNE